MITLTNPIPVTTVLGSSSKTNYDRLEIVSLVYDVVGQVISGACRLICSTAPATQNITGSFNIPVSGGPLTISIPNLPFFAAITLNAAAQSTVANWIQGAQNTVEAGLVSVGAVQGVQSTGL